RGGDNRSGPKSARRLKLLACCNKYCDREKYRGKTNTQIRSVARDVAQKGESRQDRREPNEQKDQCDNEVTHHYPSHYAEPLPEVCRENQRDQCCGKEVIKRRRFTLISKRCRRPVNCFEVVYTLQQQGE